MPTLFEDELVEATVALAASGRLGSVTAAAVAEFHRDRERCYAVADPDQRTEAFARVHLDWFGRWGLRQRLETGLSRFPALADALEAMVFRQARGRHDEAAELYRDQAGQRRGVLALRPDRLVTEPALTGFLHHELAHLADMVSPEFGYSPAPGTGAPTASHDRLIRERYRLLWAIRIDGALARRDLPGLLGVERRRAEFEKAFGFLPEPRRSSVFDDLWNGVRSTHDDLLHLAADPRELVGHRETTPGAPCPLCGFAAFRWSTSAELSPEGLARVRAEFPGWHPDEPLCARCAEIYDAISRIEYPSTVCLPGIATADH